MNTEQRARFEDAIKSIGYGALKRREDNGCYEYAPTEHAWSGFQAAETPLLERIAELEGQLANREPFVVQLPCVIKAAEKYAENYDDDDRECIKTDVINAFYAGTKFCKAAITAAGGRCE